METKIRHWDYKLPKNFQPQNDYQWQWFLERKINYEDLHGLDMEKVRKYLDKLKIDEGKRLMLKAYFKYYGK